MPFTATNIVQINLIVKNSEQKCFVKMTKCDIMNMEENKKTFKGVKNMNNSEALTTLIVGGRTAKEYSQRELARRVGISNSSLNDIENGRVAKPDPEILKRIAEELDLSLQQLLKGSDNV
jgi:ribosome-binding protein aMBF1 (putative translation factor)